MTVPLIILAVLSVAGGFVNVPHVLGGNAGLHHYLHTIIQSSGIIHVNELSHSTEYLLMGVSVSLAVIAILFARHKFLTRTEIPAASEDDLTWIQKLSYNKFYVDELYHSIISKPLGAMGRFTLHFIEKNGIDALVNGVGKMTVFSGKSLRYIQTGNTGFYVFAMVIGILLMLAMNLIK